MGRKVDDFEAAQEAFDAAKAQVDADPEAAKKAVEEENHQTTAQRLVTLAEECERFHDQRGDGYLRLCVNGHLETWPVRSKSFREWLARQFYDETGKVAGSQAIQDALSVIEGKCRFESTERTLSVRVASDVESTGKVWIDLTDSEWQAVCVDATGWRIEQEPPPLFRRYQVAAAHILPERGGDIEDLRQFLNVKDDHAWTLLVAWLVAALMPEIPHPILLAHGEQGSAKSSLVRMLGLLIDPSRVRERSEPGEVREWVQMADHSWMICLDNVSRLPDWLSDALCKAVTGDGFSKRMLYTDNEDVIYEFRRVIALTGIEVVASRADLLDRCLLLGLLPIAPNQRRSESELWQAFEEVRPRLFGALLDLLAGVLSELPNVHLTSMPRMADFARVGVAVARVMGWEDETFLSAYRANVANQHEEALSASEIGQAVIGFIEAQEGEEWSGVMKQFLEALTEFIGADKAKRRDWPKNAKGLSGQLRRIAPNLRAVGVWIEFGERTKKGYTLSLRKQQEQGRETSTPSTPSSSQSHRNGKSGEHSPDGVNFDVHPPSERSPGFPSHSEHDEHDEHSSPPYSEAEEEWGDNEEYDVV
jgi:hypothetical protein